MPAYAGKDILLKVNTTGSTYVALGGMRAKSITINSESIDITNSDSTGLWREFHTTAGVKQLSASGSGVFLDGADVNKIMTNMMTTTQVYLTELVVPGLGTFTGNIAYTQLAFAGNHNGEVTYDVTIESAGPITFA